MSVMFRNSNADVEKELAVEDYKAHPVRNRMAILAVTLTTILICVVFTVGFGFTTALSLSFGASPGPGADSCSIYGDEEVLERTRTLSQVDWAAYVKRCSTTYLHNKEFSGLDVRLLIADEVHYDKNMVELISPPRSGRRNRSGVYADSRHTGRGRRSRKGNPDDSLRLLSKPNR